MLLKLAAYFDRVTINNEDPTLNTASQSVDLTAEHLVSANWLQREIENGNSNIRIVDMRGYVQVKTDSGGYQEADYLGAIEDFRKEHIPGAIYLDWTSDIVDMEDLVPVQSAAPEALASRFGSCGIDNTTLVIAYDAHPAMQFATRLWWLFRYLGNKNVRVLEGGWNEWLASGRPTTSDISLFPPKFFSSQVDPKWRLSAQDVLQQLQTRNPSVRILDARDAEQFTGLVRRGPRGGHIPGAVNIPREALFASPGKLRPVSELKDVFQSAGIKNPDEKPEIIAYCNGGVAATSVLFALSILGYSQLGNYDGSWNEWTEQRDLPIEP